MGEDRSGEDPTPHSVWDDEPGDAHVDAGAAWEEPRRSRRPLPPPTPSTRPFDERRLLEAIGHRASGIRLRRRTRALGVMAAALVLLLVTTALRLTSEDAQLTTGTTSTTGTLTPLTDPPLLGIDPVPSSTAPLPPLLTPVTPAPSTTRSTTGGLATVTTRRTTTTAAGRAPGDRPDGARGWDDGETTCTEGVDVPADAGPPREGLGLRIALDRTDVRSGGAVTATITVTNSGSPVSLHLRTPTSRTDAWFLVTPARAASSTLTTEPERRDSVVVPGRGIDGDGTAVLTRTVRAVRCGDTSADPATGLPPGTYLVGAALAVSLSSDGELRPWRTSTEQVVVTG